VGAPVRSNMLNMPKSGPETTIIFKEQESNYYYVQSAKLGLLCNYCRRRAVRIVKIKRNIKYRLHSPVPIVAVIHTRSMVRSRRTFLKLINKINQ